MHNVLGVAGVCNSLEVSADNLLAQIVADVFLQLLSQQDCHSFIEMCVLIFWELSQQDCHSFVEICVLIFWEHTNNVRLGLLDPVDIPGILALTAAPTSSGAKIVLNKFCNKGPGFRLTAAPDVLPSTWHNTNGMVKIPSKLDATVSNKASAVLAPTVCTG